MRSKARRRPRATQFIELAADLASHAVRTKATDVAALLVEKYGTGTVQDRIDDTVGKIREKMVLHKFQRLEGGVYGAYVHHDGTVGVIVECKGGAANDELLRDVAAHIAALNPPYATSPTCRATS